MAAVPCAEHHSGHESGSKKKESGGVNLLVDCMGVDMQKADAASYDKPDVKKDLIAYPLIADIAVSRFLPTDTGIIRGPPPDWLVLSQIRPSVLVTTQRRRI